MKPISNTAFYCCGIRMMDAQRWWPICGDRYAEKFMDQRGMEILRRFRGQRAPNMGNVARHRFIDDWLRARIAANPNQRVILIGAGFDSRAFRLPGGEWIELDEPHLLDYKNSCLPAQQCINPLQRIAIDFSTDSLADKLQPFADGTSTIFIIEGVTMYLPVAALTQTLQTLRHLFPRHVVIADLMSKRFIDTVGRSTRRIIAELGAHLIPPEDPGAPFIDAGYRQTVCEPIVMLAMRYRGLRLTPALMQKFGPQTLKGYSVRVFEA